MVNWVQIARVIFTETRSLAEREFVTAERSIGAGRGRILFRHIIPHLVSTVLVYGTLGIATTVLLEATLSFLGIGVQPPMPSWATSSTRNQTYFTTAPWLVFFPGLAIIILALGFKPGRRRTPRDSRSDAEGAVLMIAYLLSRLVQSVAILVGVTLVTFFLLFIVPADPARQIAGRKRDAGGCRDVRKELGLNLPFHLRTSAISAIWPRVISDAPTCRGARYRS